MKQKYFIPIVQRIDIQAGIVLMTSPTPDNPDPNDIQTAPSRNLYV